MKELKVTIEDSKMSISGEGFSLEEVAEVAGMICTFLGEQLQMLPSEIAEIIKTKLEEREAQNGKDNN
jgi:hypothetical protein